MTAPTARQLEALRLINGSAHFPPTVRELADAMGFASTNAVTELLQKLVGHGLLQRNFKQARAMWLTAAGKRALGVKS